MGPGSHLNAQSIGDKKKAEKFNSTCTFHVVCSNLVALMYIIISDYRRYMERTERSRCPGMCRR